MSIMLKANHLMNSTVKNHLPIIMNSIHGQPSTYKSKYLFGTKRWSSIFKD